MNKKILLVEDDPFLLDIYETKLKEAGFSVQVAANGKECLLQLEKDKPDLLILDIVLPEIDGWEIIRKVQQDENLKDLKVAVLSNLGQKDAVKKGLKRALKYFIKAHYTPSEVVAEIKKII